jgi:UPF0716 protein FxsA
MSLLLVLVFLVLPVAEIYVLIQVGHLIGVLPTIGLLIVVSVAGAWLVRREGMRAWRAVTGAMAEGRVPGREVADGALVLFGGALLLTPGFVSDVLGLVLLLPPTRAVVRRVVLAIAARRVGLRRGALRRQRGGVDPGRAPGPSSGSSHGDVIEGEVVEPD